MNKIISALALLAVLTAATSSCTSNNSKKVSDSATVEVIEDLAPIATDSVSADSLSDTIVDLPPTE